jgi:galactose oxidase-like protein/Kelch motif protein
MHRSRLLIVATITVSFVITAMAFRASPTSMTSAGSLIPTAPMLSPRSGHTATLLPDGKVLIVGGMRRNQDFYKSAELYDPATGKFQPTGEMRLGRVGHSAVLLRSGKVLIAGGWIGHGTTDSAELYDPATGKFTAISKMTTRRARPSATLLQNGNVLIAGGDDHDARDAAIASAEIFNVDTLSFEPTGSLHRPRGGQTATLLTDGRVLMAGGTGGGLIATAELYDPRTGTFSGTGSLITPRYKHTAGLLPDGRVLLAGGSDERDWNGNLNSAEIYDPRTGKFSAAASLNDSRFKLPDEAVQLLSGKLLVAGGSKQAEIFDPATGRFGVVSGVMSDRWHYMSETRLCDGSVLLAGGYPNSDQASAQTWIYRP